jgi:hypothetical protein
MVTKPKSRLIKVKQDRDFCSHYKGFNPNYYTIWVCSECGYASDERHFDKLTGKETEKVRKFLTERKVNIPYKELRTYDEAVNAFKLGIFFAEFLGAPPSRLAGLYLKFAWLYRSAEDAENEKKLTIRAIEAYDKSLTTERYPIEQMTDVMVTYLVGALNYNIGEYTKATQYLSRVIGDQNARTAQSTIYEQARNLWQDIRYETENGGAPAENS